MDHDAAYKEFFVFIRMVRNFLGTFATDAAMRFNFKVYERLPTSFLADAGLRREGDLAWRFGLLDDPRGAAIVPIEFQSTPDYEMVQRMELYKALCLSAAARHPWGRDPARLRVLPVVVYNGAKPWTTAGDAPPAWTTDAVASPKASYRLVDLSALDGYDLEAADVAGAFRAVAVRLAGMLAEPEDAALRRAFTSWIVDLMKHRKLRMEGLDITQLLAGGKPMIAETMDRWTQEWLRQGRNEGRQQGLQEGRDEGLQRGLRQGRDEGLKQQKALVRQQAERKFGPEVAAVLDRLLGPVADPGPVRDAALAIVDCETGAELLGRIR